MKTFKDLGIGSKLYVLSFGIDGIPNEIQEQAVVTTCNDGNMKQIGFTYGKDIAQIAVPINNTCIIGLQISIFADKQEVEAFYYETLNKVVNSMDAAIQKISSMKEKVNKQLNSMIDDIILEKI